jgi:hypothetical protein
LEGANGKARRGWKGLALVEGRDLEDVKNRSCESDVEVGRE